MFSNIIMNYDFFKYIFVLLYTTNNPKLSETNYEISFWNVTLTFVIFLECTDSTFNPDQPLYYSSSKTFFYNGYRVISSWSSRHHRLGSRRVQANVWRATRWKTLAVDAPLPDDRLPHPDVKLSCHDASVHPHVI